MVEVQLLGPEARQLVNPGTGRSITVVASAGLVFSAWRPTAEEIALMQQGKPVWVVIKGELVPEHHLAVGDKRQVIPPSILSKAVRNSSILGPDNGAAALKRRQRAERLENFLTYSFAAFYISAVLAASWLIGTALYRVGSFLVAIGG